MNKNLTLCHFVCYECGSNYFCNKTEIKQGWINPGSKPILPGIEKSKENRENFINCCPEGCYRILNCGHIQMVKSKLCNNELVNCNVCNLSSIVYFNWCGALSQNEFGEYFS